MKHTLGLEERGQTQVLLIIKCTLKLQLVDQKLYVKEKTHEVLENQ